MKISTPSGVNDILELFSQKGYEIYIVGGVVRDLLLGREAVDWDFTTNATPEQILEVFPDGFYDNVYGTVGIKNGENKPFEITTFRSDHGYSDGRRPDRVVWGKTLEDDLKRRDFTINSLSLRKTDEGKFELIDLFGGEYDLTNKIIRTVGNPNERFSEDGLRMMRAVRIAAQLQFTIEGNTLEAIRINVKNLEKIAWERIRDELLKIMESSWPADGYMLLRNTGIGAYILPEMEPTFGVEQKSPGRHHIYDVGKHSVESLRMCPSINPITRLATLIHDVGKIRTQRIYPDGRITFYNHEMESAKIASLIAERLKFSNVQKDLFVRLVRWHQFSVDERQTDSAIRRFIKNVGVENISEMLALRTGDRLGGGARETSWRLEEYKLRIGEVQQQPFSLTDLKISGKDVMEIKNITPGPMVGNYLQMLFDEVVEKGLVNTKERLTERLGEI